MELIPVTVNQFIYHVSNPVIRDKILADGLLPMVGDQRCFEWEENKTPAIFCTNAIDLSELFDSTYNDDVWRIDTTGLALEAFKDINYNDVSKHIVLFNPIPPRALKLVYTGTAFQDEMDRTPDYQTIFKI